MLSLDDAGRVIHASSFSKTVSPGVRVGYLAGPEDEIAKLAKRGNEHYISPNMLAESVVWSSAARARSTRTSSSSTGRCASAATRSSRRSREQTPEAEFVVPGGGYFLWLTLNDDVDTRGAPGRGARSGVAFVAGPDFMLEGGRSSLRLSFASVPAEQIAEGVGRIAAALEGAAGRRARPELDRPRTFTPALHRA